MPPRDALDDVLATVRLEPTTYGVAELAGAWGFSVTGPCIASRATFYAVTSGSAAFWAGASPPHRLEAGDLVLVAPGCDHALGSDPRTRVVPFDRLARGSPADGFSLVVEGKGPRTRIVMGCFRFVRDASRILLACLPRVLHISSDGPRGDRLRRTLLLLEDELATLDVGARSTADRLAEILLVQALRVHLVPGGARSPRDRCRGFLRGLSDEHIARSLALVHQVPERAWTVADLARRVGLSRTVFAERFVALVGTTPMHYVRRWRIERAASELRESGAGVEGVAERFGYASVAAFTRAFRRELGTTPAAYRRAAPGTPPPS